MTILRIEAGQAPAVKEIANSLESIQAEVGGIFQAICMDDTTILCCNDEGSTEATPHNVRHRAEAPPCAKISRHPAQKRLAGRQPACVVFIQSDGKFSDAMRHFPLCGAASTACSRIVGLDGILFAGHSFSWESIPTGSFVLSHKTGLSNTAGSLRKFRCLPVKNRSWSRTSNFSVGKLRR